MTEVNRGDPRYHFRRVVAAVSQASRVPVRYIVGEGSFARATLPRTVLIRIFRKRGMPYKWIASRLSRDHTTIIHHWRRTEADIAAGTDRGKRITEIETETLRIVESMEEPQAVHGVAVRKRKHVEFVLDPSRVGGLVQKTGELVCDP